MCKCNQGFHKIPFSALTPLLCPKGLIFDLKYTDDSRILKARIENHVEIGANTCIDRGSWRDTVVGEHTKIDNLVQIAHNVVIGRSCLICGQVGVAGSVTISDYVTLGGRVGIRDHVNIASKVRLAANSCVTKDISEPGDYGGFPAIPIRDWRRQIAIHRRTLKQEFCSNANTIQKPKI